jgi:hypothetical protein
MHSVLPIRIRRCNGWWTCPNNTSRGWVARIASRIARLPRSNRRETTSYVSSGRAGGMWLFGAAAISRFIALRTAQRFDDARAYSRSLWEQRDEEPGVAVEAAARRQYGRLFAAMPRPAYATYGNVDLPRLWGEFTGDGVQVLDGAAIELDGRSFGFVGGGLQTRYRTPYERSDEEYAARIAAVGAVDVLCCRTRAGRPGRSGRPRRPRTA